MGDFDEMTFSTNGGISGKASRDAFYAVAFLVPRDEGGPGHSQPIGGLGGDLRKYHYEHRAVVQSVGSAPVLLIHGDARPYVTGESRATERIVDDHSERAVEAAGYHQSTPDSCRVQCASNCWVISCKFMPLARGCS